MSVADAARSDSRLKALQALRDRLAADIDSCESKRDVAALAQRFMDVVEQIAELAPPEAKPKETGLSEFEKRLHERESKTKAPRRAKGEGNVRRSRG